MDKQTELKILISEKAAHFYTENNRFTIEALAKLTEVTPADIYNLFPNRSSILRYFYESRIYLYKEQLTAIDGYNKYSLSEKLSNLFLTIIDMFMNYREFVLLTYKQFIVCPVQKSSFEKLFIKEVEAIFDDDERISTSSTLILYPLFYISVFYQFNALILFWKNDKSDMYQQSLALIDKWSSLQQEIFYTKIVDRSFDLGKFLFYNSPLQTCFKQ